MHLQFSSQQMLDVSLTGESWTVWLLRAICSGVLAPTMQTGTPGCCRTQESDICAMSSFSASQIRLIAFNACNHQHLSLLRLHSLSDFVSLERTWFLHLWLLVQSRLHKHVYFLRTQWIRLFGKPHRGIPVDKHVRIHVLYRTPCIVDEHNGNWTKTKKRQTLHSPYIGIANNTDWPIRFLEIFHSPHPFQLQLLVDRGAPACSCHTKHP